MKLIEGAKITVYRYTNKINGKMYIGITNNTYQRKWKHEHLQGGTVIFSRAIRKYGFSNFIYEELINADSREEAKKLEIFFIEKYKTLDSGYNCTRGGDGSCGLYGENNPSSNVSETTAICIILDPCSLVEAQEKYGVPFANVWAIRSGKSWRYLDRSNVPEYKNSSHKLTKQIYQCVINDDCSPLDAARKYDVSITHVRNIRSGKRCKYLDRSDAPEYKNDKQRRGTYERN